jgi:hypothetical protein
LLSVSMHFLLQGRRMLCLQIRLRRRAHYELPRGVTALYNQLYNRSMTR